MLQVKSQYLTHPQRKSHCHSRTTQVWTKLQHDNKAAIPAVHSDRSFKLLVRVMSHLVAFMQVAGEWLWLMKGSCSQLTGSPPQWVPVHVHQWKATFFPLSGAWLCRTAKKEVGKMKDNNLTQHRPDLTMWGLCARVDQQTEGPFSWSHCFTNPRPAFPLQFNYAANTCIFTCWSQRRATDNLQSS